MNLSRWPIRQTVIINLRTDKAIRGVLWAKKGPVLVLKQAVLLAGTHQTPIDGEAVVERSNVDFIQVVQA